MDTGDLVMLGVLGSGGYLFYQHQQQAAASTPPVGPLGASTGSVVHQCPQGYDWVPDSTLAAGGSCVLKGSSTAT
jgi:hypothetical protein